MLSYEVLICFWDIAYYRVNNPRFSVKNRYGTVDSSTNRTETENHSPFDKPRTLCVQPRRTDAGHGRSAQVYSPALGCRYRQTKTRAIRALQTYYLPVV